MVKNEHPDELDISRFLGEHCKQAAVNDEFRRAVLGKTHAIIRSRRKCVSPWYRLRSLTGIGVAVLALFAVLFLANQLPFGKQRDHAGGNFLGILPITSVSADQLLAVTSTRGHVTLASGRSLKPGDRIGARSIVRTGEGGRITLISHAGSILHLDSKSEIVINRSGYATIKQGRLYCSNRAHEIKQIGTPGGSIRLLGTVLDAAVINHETAAVAVIQGKVKLSNAHGETLLESGKRAVITASAAPEAGSPMNISAQTAWYDGRNAIMSDSGEIAYLVNRGQSTQGEPGLTEVWAMKADGSGKHRVTSCMMFSAKLGDWWPGSPYVVVRGGRLVVSPTDKGSFDCFGPLIRLLNITTGEEVKMELPEGYDPLCIAISPNGNLIAFSGSHTPISRQRENGVWTYDIRTGQVKKVLDAPWQVWAPELAWSPDSRRIVVSGNSNCGIKSMVVVDVPAGRTRTLNIAGSHPSISPDGTKLVYRADSDQAHTADGIYILELKPGSVPEMVCSEDEGAQAPRWSPDGKKILYNTKSGNWPDPMTYSLFTVNADGSERRKIYEGKGCLEATAWDTTGKVVYARTNHTLPDAGIMAVNANGTGRVDDLGGNDTDSILTSDEQAQAASAMDAIREAKLYINSASRKMQEGHLNECRKALKTAAALIVELPWRHPMADLSLSDICTSADAINLAASISNERMLSSTCSGRMQMLYYLLRSSICCEGNNERLPLDLETASRWTKRGCITPYVDGKKGFSYPYFVCPGKQFSKPIRYTYKYPVNGRPKIGDIIIACPNHPKERIIWNRDLDSLLAHRAKAATAR